MVYSLGIDVGGTFTDLYVIEDGKEYIVKSPTTRHNLVEGVLNAFDQTKINPADIENIVHGSTIATNAVIERNYPPTAFVTTRGFRDLIEIGRYHRKELYNPYQTKPEPLVKRRFRFEVTERVDSDGNVIKDLDETNAREIALKITNLGIRNVAIGFINSYMNNINEKKMESILKQVNPGMLIATSADVIPKIRPLGRFITTIINSALQSIIVDYITELEGELKNRGFNGNFWLIQSNGGIIRSDYAVKHSEMFLLSGPSGGVAAACFFSGKSGISSAVTMDMGGTSCDVSLIEQGTPVTTTEREIDWDAPVPIPMVDITTIGAGGGSIAWVDNQGILKVGPESAGADPGPAFYGRGQGYFTVSDANLILGYMDANAFMDGKLAINRKEAESAALELGEKLGTKDIIMVSKGVITVANHNMANALREVLIKKGRDPRDFTLVAFGGAGPLHASAISRILSIPQVIIPARASVFSAFGAITLDARHEFYDTLYTDVELLDIQSMDKSFTYMGDVGTKLLYKQGIKKIILQRFAELRYIGQSYELEVELTGNNINVDYLKDKFIMEHDKRYGVVIPDNPIALMTLHTSAVGVMEKPELIELEKRNSNSPIIKGERKIWLADVVATKAKVIDGLMLGTGDHIVGPAIVEYPTTTVLIDSLSTADVDEYGNIIIAVGGGQIGH